MKKIPVILLLLLAFSLSKAQQRVEYTLTMWTTGTTPMWDGNMVKYYGFGPGFLIPPIFPGPVLEANEGDTLVVTVRNQSQGAPHTIHWHGLDVDQANDGVPQTSFVIPHMHDTDYVFIAPHPGAYLYHCHVASVVHVQLGMYGSVIIHPRDGSKSAWTNGPGYNRDYRWLMSEFDKSWHDSIPVHNTNDSVHEVFAVPPFIPDYFLINGLSRQQLSDSSTAIQAQANEQLLLRLSNVGFYMNEVVFPSELNASIIMSDGRPLPNSLRRDTLRLLPGERYGVLLSPVTEFSDSISVSYLNMNTRQSWDRERVPVSVQGVLGRSPVLVPELQIWPNPSVGEIFISNPGEWQKAELFGADGRLLLQQELRKGQNELDIQALPEGLYFLRASNLSGQMAIEKVLLRRK